MKKANTLISILLFCLVLAACKKEKLPTNPVRPPGLGGDVTAQTAIDNWILDSLTKPYNITAIYRWNPWNASLYKTVTPADESRVLPLFSALKRVWIDPYNDETGSDIFMKKYSPKQFVLLGSVEYDYYSVTLGQAEGGNSIVFFDVNQNYDKNPITSIRRVIHTAHHEFGHILHQTVLYPSDFRGTSSKLGLPGYTATWFNVSASDALNQGYATSYSRSSSDEDFVETIATMLSEGKGKWDEKKAVTNATARKALQIKEDFVVNYFLSVWKISFYSLQTRVQNALSMLFPTPAVEKVYGFQKSYIIANMNPKNTSLLPQSTGFTKIYNAAKTGVDTMPFNPKLVMDSMAVIANTDSTYLLRLYMHQGAESNIFYAHYTYLAVKNADGSLTFVYKTANATGAATKKGAEPLLQYFNGNSFFLEWFAKPSDSYFPRIKFIPKAMPDNYFVTLLKN